MRATDPCQFGGVSSTDGGGHVRQAADAAPQRAVFLSYLLDAPNMSSPPKPHVETTSSPTDPPLASTISMSYTAHPHPRTPQTPPTSASSTQSSLAWTPSPPRQGLPPCLAPTSFASGQTTLRPPRPLPLDNKATPQGPKRLHKVLAASSLQDNLYFNLCPQNMLTVGIGTCVYLCAASDINIQVTNLWDLHPRDSVCTLHPAVQAGRLPSFHRHRPWRVDTTIQFLHQMLSIPGLQSCMLYKCA